MNVLIWVCCFFCMIVIQVVIKGNGIVLGGLPTALLWIGTSLVAGTLCKAWKFYKNYYKEAKKAGKTTKDYIKDKVPPNIIFFCEINHGQWEKLKDRLDVAVQEKQINKSEAKFLLWMYSNK